ncbi:RlpA-like double-psi beta-barrel-protein domain-containing protein-containing protein [Absidia repens]|uniref:RlpA-like double-psi beta-barrel-protein domain-containing protein-containing protein n=1 Tax=Absidia repens TaxID=90262 RepID=A0A1X2I9E5_9FUNG|nr:RlpA-like double-psi beta-barrel-protein domain-containing protein-containing protein [Absidia repens]
MMKSLSSHSILFFIAFLLTLNFTFTTAYPLEGRSSSFSGDATYYTVGLGSCGKTSHDSQLVAALSSDLMSKGKYCGKKIKIKTPTGTVTATVVDTCPGCAKDSVDLSMAAFKKIGKIAAGRISINWSFV